MVRILAGYFLLSAFFVIDGNLKWLTLIGILPLLPGLTGWCPAYAPFGFSACPRRS